MNLLRINISLSEQEYEFFMKELSTKKKSFWKGVQDEINKAFENLSEPDDAETCTGKKTKLRKSIDLPPRLGKIVKCHAKKMGVTPGALIYRIVFAKHLIDVMKESDQLLTNGGGSNWL